MSERPKMVVVPVYQPGQEPKAEDSHVEEPEAIVEEANVQDVEEPNVEGVKEDSAEQSEFNEVEQKAMELGWKPDGENQFGERIAADEFLRRQPLFDKIEEVKKHREHDVNELKRVISDLSAQMKKSEAAGYKKALEDLDSKRMLAAEEGDMEAFVRADEEYIKTRSELERLSEPEPEVSKPQVPEISEEAKAFQERNKSWFGQQDVDSIMMTKEALEFDALLYKMNPDISEKEASDKIEEFIHKKFPDKFRNSKRQNPVAVSSSAPVRSRNKGEATIDDLNDFQKGIFAMIKKDNPDFTIAEYLNQSKAKAIRLGD